MEYNCYNLDVTRNNFIIDWGNNVITLIYFLNVKEFHKKIVCCKCFSSVKLVNNALFILADDKRKTNDCERSKSETT